MEYFIAGAGGRVPVSKLSQRYLWVAVWAALGFAVAAPAYAQKEPPTTQPNSNQPIDVVVTIGTRVKGRTELDTAVPVDHFDLQQIQSVLSPDISDAVSKLVPSFNIGANAVNDGASDIRTFTLRGLPGQESLILLNGKRRHRSALLFTAAWGSHGPDLSPIPSIALKSMEVLRDGASALYGSDAIAGVINFNLKDAASGGSIEVTDGHYADYNHEGNYVIAANKGLALGDSGFLNLSFEWAKRDRADRGGLYDFPIAESGLLPSQAINTVMPNAVSVDGIPLGTRYGPDALTERDFNHDGKIDSLIWGSDGIPDDPDTRFKDNLHLPEMAWGATPYDSKKFLFNTGYKLKGGMEVYGFGNYMKKHSNSSFFYRSPSADQLKPLRLQDGTIYNPRAALYPAGFDPRFFGTVVDESLVGGVKGNFAGGTSYDVSARYGMSSLSYFLKGSMNPSMGPATPTSFHPGKLVDYETAVNADFSRDIGVNWSSDPLTLGYGFEYRDEGYKIVKGDKASYEPGPYALPDPWNFEITQAEVDAGEAPEIQCRIPGLEAMGSLCPAGDPINNAVAVGSNGFPGYSPSFTSNYSRPSEAGYISAATDLTHKLFLSLAGRYEHFSDFGGNFSWRVATRYQIGEKVALRASVGTGFRAPTPGQISTTVVSTNISDGALVAKGLFPATSPEAQIFGAKPLDPELAKSYSFGVVTQPVNGLTMTLDFYDIRLNNRLTLSSPLVPTVAQQQELDALGVAGANTIQQVQFYTNDADTKTLGADLVTQYTKNWASGGATTIAFSANYNHTEILNRPFRPGIGYFIGDARKWGLEHARKVRGVTTIRQQWSKYSIEARINTYGPYTDNNFSGTEFEHFGTLNQVDMLFSWYPSEHYKVSFGGRNIFNTFPPLAHLGTCCGQNYDDGPYDWFGRFFYARFTANF